MLNSGILYLEETAKRFPNKVAIIDDKRQVTFSELKQNALTIAESISPLFINQPIAVFIPKSIACIECFMGALYSGNFYVPIDTKSPIERVNKVIENLAPKVIFTTSDYINILQEQIQDKTIQIINIGELSFHGSSSYKTPVSKIIDTDPIYCIYTSGSTGTPKGVVVSHRGVLDYIAWAVETYQVTENDTIGNQAPFYFDNSTLDIYLMLKTGATLVLIPEFQFSFPYKLVEYLNNQKINFIFWVPSVMNNFLKINVFKDILPAYLNKILFAGEVMPVKTLNYWLAHMPLALYSNLYGPTEITVDCTFYTVDRTFDENDSLPIGIPCRNSDILILNADNKLVIEDEIGELCVRGSSLALGYWNDSVKTQQAFVQNPLHHHYPELIYKTGDLVKYNERGEIIYMGRKDSQIKHMGYRIELGEIEKSVLSIAGISNACVLYDKEKSAIILLAESVIESVDKIFIIKELINKIPKYMVPSVIIKLDKLPINSNGKIDRVLLTKEYIK